MSGVTSAVAHVRLAGSDDDDEAARPAGSGGVGPHTVAVDDVAVRARSGTADRAGADDEPRVPGPGGVGAVNSGHSPLANGRRRRSSAAVPVALPRRWVILAVFALVTMSNAAAWITFAPISDVTQMHYDVSPLAVNSLSLVFMMAYVPFVFPGSWILNRCVRVRGCV